MKHNLAFQEAFSEVKELTMLVMRIVFAMSALLLTMIA